jgi:hypothetical protein
MENALRCEMCEQEFKSQSGLTLHRKKCKGKGKKAPPDRSKIGRRSKNKGKAGEQRTANLLMEFTGRNFRRTPGSGGFNKQGGVQVAGYVFGGDVICDDPKFAFCVENKNRPDAFSFPQLAAVPESAQFAEWWYQATTDAKSLDRLPMLVFKAAHASSKTVAAEHIAVNQQTFRWLDYPADAPKIIFDIYHKPVKLKIKQRFSKKVVEVETKLDNPIYVLNWRNVQKYVDCERFFRSE